MRLRGYTFLTALLVITLVLVAGCATAPAPGPATSAPATAAPVAAANPQAPSAPAAPVATASSGGISTKINVHYNDYACIDVQQLLGVDYLYPDQKYTVSASPPADNSVNVNILFIDTQDHTKMISVKPVWDTVHSVWTYNGLVPIVQFNDVTTPQQKTITIKDQGQYYLCADDRKETGSSDATIQIPVKFTRVS
ncbi:MAG TPA: hypothetical protein VLY83_02620 [Methanoregula sp.]|nr:hypothetical protein [Methanoregula sp.]